MWPGDGKDLEMRLSTNIMYTRKKNSLQKIERDLVVACYTPPLKTVKKRNKGNVVTHPCSCRWIAHTQLVPQIYMTSHTANES